VTLDVDDFWLTQTRGQVQLAAAAALCDLKSLLETGKRVAA
jgi:hypothetical protein